MLIVFENMEGGPRLVIEISAGSPKLVSIIILGPSALIPVTCLGPYSSCNRHEDENDNFQDFFFVPCCLEAIFVKLPWQCRV